MSKRYEVVSGLINRWERGEVVTERYSQIRDTVAREVTREYTEDDGNIDLDAIVETLNEAERIRDSLVFRPDS